MVLKSKKKEGFYYIDGEVKLNDVRKHYHKESIKNPNFKSKKWCEDEEQRIINEIIFGGSKPKKEIKVEEVNKVSDHKASKGRLCLGNERRKIYSFTIEPSVYEKVQKYCKTKGTSMSSLIAELCLQAINNE